MRRRLPLLLLTATLGLAAPAAEPPAVAAERLQERITRLLGPRRQPAPLPADLPNPFATARQEALAALAEPTATPATSASTEPSRLERLARSLRLGGTVQRDGQPHLIINGNIYAAGGLLTLKEDDATHLVRVKEITRNAVTLTLENEEFSLPLR